MCELQRNCVFAIKDTTFVCEQSIQAVFESVTSSNGMHKTASCWDLWYKQMTHVEEKMCAVTVKSHTCD